MSRRKVLDKKRKAEAKTKKERKWKILNGILIVVVIVMALGGLIYMEEGDPLIGFGIFLSAGILIVPNAVLMMRKDMKKKKYNHTVNTLVMEKTLTRIHDDKPYRKKIIWGVFREGFLNVAAFLLVYMFALVNNYLRANYAVFSRDRGKGMIILFALMILFFSCLAYSGGCTVIRLIRAFKRDYVVCRGVVEWANGVDCNLYIKGKKKIHKFDYCRGVGVKAQSLAGKEAVIVFLHDEIYVMEYKEEVTA